MACLKDAKLLFTLKMPIFVEMKASVTCGTPLGGGVLRML